MAACLAFLAVVFFLASTLAVAERPFPKPRGPVNDFAGVISPQYESKISALAREVLEKTGTAIVVVTMPDIGGAEYNDYANRLYSAWGIGKKGEDKGVLIFVTVKERKMRIETGYGVEGILPDGLVGEIRDRYMIPYLRKNQFGEGLFNGTLAIAQVIAKNAGVRLTGTSAVPRRIKKSRSGLSFLPFLIFIVIFLFFSRRRGGSWLFFLPFFFGGGRGFGGGGMGDSFGGFGGGFGGFGGGMSGGGGAGGGF
jgi:uncharacterized protein